MSTVSVDRIKLLIDGWANDIGVRSNMLSGESIIGEKNPFDGYKKIVKLSIESSGFDDIFLDSLIPEEWKQYRIISKKRARKLQRQGESACWLIRNKWVWYGRGKRFYISRKEGIPQPVFY